MSDLSDYIRNAIIPPNSDILPASAYYAAASQISSGSWDLSNLGITHFAAQEYDPLWATPIARVTSGQFALFTYNFSGNAIPTADVDNMLSVIADASNVGSGFGGYLTFDLSGGTNGIPTPVQAHIDAIFTLQFSAGLTNTGTFILSENTIGVFVTFDVSTPFSGSSINPGFSVNIGTQDNPSGSQIASYLASNDIGIPGLTFIPSGDTIMGTSTRDADFTAQPGSLYDLSGTTGVVGNQTQVGQAFIQNADITAIQNHGGFVLTN